MRFIGRIAWWKSLLTSVLFALVMFVTFEVAFDVIMPKGPSKRCSASRTGAMEALTLLLHGFAVLMTWKTLALMLVGLCWASSSACCRASAGRTASRSCCR